MATLLALGLASTVTACVEDPGAPPDDESELDADFDDTDTDSADDAMDAPPKSPQDDDIGALCTGQRCTDPGDGTIIGNNGG
ncbi:MAG: hypothetical protein R3F14_16675 [Polyangiaceae bacterium]